MTRSPHVRCRFGVLLLCLAVGSVAVAAERPKVGIAFGGGGAKGAAHIGILAALEEARVPIDYIAGTSMGSIMGGLYASGMGPEEMAAALFAVDWEDAMQDDTERRDLSFRRKEDSQRYLFDLEVGLKKDGFALSSGLMNGQKLFFLLQSLTEPVSDITDFDRLPIPFRAVATDINVGEPVVIAGGAPLATAMRASMAIPTVFSPVTLEGRLLVDGGVTNNLPVDVVRAMGADVVIAVDLGAPLESRKVQSLLEIQKQTLRFLTRKNVEPQITDADIVFHPQVSQFGTLEFGSLPAIYEAGVEEGRAGIERVRHLAVSEEEYTAFLARQRLKTSPPGVVDEIRIEGNERVDSRIIRQKIHLRPDEELDFGALADDLARVYGLGDFEQVSYRLDRGQPETGLVVRVQEKPWGPNYLHFGLNLWTDVQGTFQTSVLVNLTNTQLNSRGGELRTDLLLGRPRQILSELYQPLDYQGDWFVAATFDASVVPEGFYRDSRQVAQSEFRQVSLRADIGYQFDTTAELRLGLVRGRGEVRVISGDLPFENASDIDLGGVRFSARVDRVDSVEFPRRGARSHLDAFFSQDALGADVDYERVELGWAEFWSRKRHTFSASLAGGWASDETPFYSEFSLGGFLSLSGLPDGALRGRGFGIARLGYYNEVAPRRYLGGFLEAGNAWPDASDASTSDLVYTGTLFAGMKTSLGPIYCAYGRTDAGDGELYVIIGRTF